MSLIEHRHHVTIALAKIITNIVPTHVKTKIKYSWHQLLLKYNLEHDLNKIVTCWGQIHIYTTYILNIGILLLPLFGESSKNEFISL